jgi:hypothetical protein
VAERLGAIICIQAFSFSAWGRFDAYVNALVLHYAGMRESCQEGQVQCLSKAI